MHAFLPAFALLALAVGLAKAPGPSGAPAHRTVAGAEAVGTALR